MSNTDLFESQTADLHMLVDVLNTELDAIAARDHEKLSAAVNEKSSLLNAITARDKHIATCYDASLPEHQQAVTQINELLAQCKQQNDVNHIAANQSLVASQKLKDIFFGKTQSGYDSKGKAFSLPSAIAKGIKA